MKILMISPKAYPVPAIKGGAVETLLTNFIEKKELDSDKEIELDVITRYDSEAQKISANYKNTKILAENFEKHLKCSLLKKKYSKIKDNENEQKSNLEKKIDDTETKLYNKFILKQIKKNKYDLIVIEGGNMYSYDSIYQKVSREKLVLHIHGVLSGNQYAGEKFGTFIALSKFTQKKLIDGGFVLPENVEFLYNGVDLSNFKKTLTEDEIKEMKKKYNIKDDEKVILFCGRTVKEKGVKELLLAFKNIYLQCNAKLLIIGNSGFANSITTPYDKELYDISKEFSDRIIFTGHVYNKELYKFYSMADIAVFPHIWDEAFGLVIVEAMSTGKPIITTMSGAIPEIVIKDCGIILQKEDKELLVKELSESMIKLLSDEELCKKYSENAKKRAEYFSAEAYYKNYVEVLNNIYRKINK